ncbi:MAG: tRNA-intron lyase [Candidatus Altiarchaeales archaeon A3]|nr:MAG: tRNA-intron lyase [Candidatus Altiarchaeales archaeon A3]
MKKIRGILSGTRIMCRDKSTIEKYIFLGDEAKKLGGFSVTEGLYLIEKDILEVYDKDKNMSFEDLLEKGKNLTDDENFYIKYVVFRDLMSKGYMLATGFKFGVDFRIYDKKEGIKEKVNENNNIQSSRMHSKFLIKVVPEEYVSSFPEIAGNIRLAKAVNKNLVYALVDKDSDVIYYQIDMAKI